MTSGMAVCIDSFSHTSSLFSFSILAIVFFYLGICGLRLPGPYQVPDSFPSNFLEKITYAQWIDFCRATPINASKKRRSSAGDVFEKSMPQLLQLRVNFFKQIVWLISFFIFVNGKLERLENDLLYLRPERYQYWFPDSAKATSPLRPNSGNSKYYISNLYFPKFTRHADTSLKDVNLSYFLLVEGWRMVGTSASALIYFHLSTRIIIITFGFDRC